MNYITVVCRRVVRKVYMDDIIYIERNGRKLTIATESEHIEFYEQMKNVCDKLDKRFYPCLQSFLINIEKVDCMENQTIYFHNGEKRPMARDSFVRTKQYFSAYLKNLR